MCSGRTLALQGNFHPHPPLPPSTITFGFQTLTGVILQCRDSNKLGALPDVGQTPFKNQERQREIGIQTETKRKMGGKAKLVRRRRQR